jgi:dolichol-phosphate mannosyltransferase
MLLSVIVPCYNEEAVIRETHKRLTAVLRGLQGADYEILYVNDGSRDQTETILREISREDERARLVLFARNFGHQMAVTAGLEHAAGEALVIIDADLQDPPEVIPEMLERWRDGYHVVYGVRSDREGETAFKLFTAKIFYRLINSLSNIEMPLDVGDFRLIDRRVAEALKQMPERDRFLRGMVSWVGFKQCGVFYRRAARFAGETKYPFVKMLRFAADAVLSFSFTPLRLAIYTGFFAIAAAFAGIIYAVYKYYTNDVVRGWASTFVALLLMSGAQLITIGIIGEYIGRIYGEVKQRPLYLVQEKLGFAANEENNPSTQSASNSSSRN